MGSKNSSSKKSYEDAIEELGLGLVENYSAIDYGPLSYHENKKKHAGNFNGGSYSLVSTNRTHGIIVYRLYDNDRSNEYGQYLILEKKAGNLATQIDLAVFPDWNKMTLNKTLWIPPSFLFFVGTASSQKKSTGFLHGGGLQVFIPNVYLKHIHEAQTNDSHKRNKAIIDGLKAQIQFFQDYTIELQVVTEKYLKDFTSETNVLLLFKNGNNFKNLPSSIKEALKEYGTGQSISAKDANHYPKGTYVVHRETLHLPNGKKINLALDVSMRFDGQSFRKYKSGNTIINETTYKYTIIYEWKI